MTKLSRFALQTNNYFYWSFVLAHLCHQTSALPEPLAVLCLLTAPSRRLNPSCGQLQLKEGSADLELEIFLLFSCVSRGRL